MSWHVGTLDTDCPTEAQCPTTPLNKIKLQVLSVLSLFPVLLDHNRRIGTSDPKCATHLDPLPWVSWLEGRKGIIMGIVLFYQ